MHSKQPEAFRHYCNISLWDSSYKCKARTSWSIKKGRVTTGRRNTVKQRGEAAKRKKSTVFCCLCYVTIFFVCGSKNATEDDHALYFSVCSQPHAKLRVTSVPTLELPMPVTPQLLKVKFWLRDFCDQFVRYLPRYWRLNGQRSQPADLEYLWMVGISPEWAESNRALKIKGVCNS